MTIATRCLTALFLLALSACSSIEIETTDPTAFANGNYIYYKWRTEPLPW